MAECSLMVAGTAAHYKCRIDGDPLGNHDGPCACPDVPRSVRARERWEAAQKQPEEGLGAFQGPAQTTAERYTDGATPVPGQSGDIADHPGTVATRPVADTDALGFDESPEPMSYLERQEFPSEPIKQREGDQVLPTINERPFVQDEVIGDIEARKQIGIKRYGTPLQPMNGRDALLDLYEELVDAAIYLRQVRIERQEMREEINYVYGFAVTQFGIESEVVMRIKKVLDWLEQ